MPFFPNINTLVNKVTLSGQEVIQISATEKVTLQQIVEQLGFTPNSLLTGLEEIAAGELNLPAATDTLIQALAKLISLSGGNQLIILPVALGDGEGIGFKLVVLVDNSLTGGTGGLVSNVSFSLIYGSPRISVQYKIWDNNLVESPLLTCDTIQELSGWVNGDGGDANLYFWGDNFREITGASIDFNPGDVIFHSGASINEIVVPIYYWNHSKTLFLSTSCTIITQVNVLRSMFNRGSGGTFTDIVYLFSEGFDNALGTEYQCITIQKVRNSGGKAYLKVKKEGYLTNQAYQEVQSNNSGG